MARPRRTIIAECAHHVVARSVDRRRLFPNGFAKGRYLRRLHRLCEKYRIRVHAYCLMDNHIHLILTPPDETSLSRMIQTLHSWLALRYNRRASRKGPVFEDRFYCSPMDTPHFFTAMRYVELNPRKAGIREWQRYQLTSARAHTEGRRDKLVKLDDEAFEHRYGEAETGWERWRDFLNYDVDDAAMLMRHVMRNKPLGDPKWIGKLESELKRTLRIRPVGRPKRMAATEADEQVAVGALAGR